MAATQVVEIKTKDQFDELVNSTPYVVIQAHAAWCGPCKAMSPLFNKHAADKGSDRFAFARFDTDEITDLSFELGVRSIPAFFVFENGDKAQGLTGANPPALKTLVESLAKKSTAGGESDDGAAAAAPVPAASDSAAAAPAAAAPAAAAPAAAAEPAPAEEKKEEVFTTSENF